MDIEKIKHVGRKIATFLKLSIRVFGYFCVMIGIIAVCQTGYYFIHGYKEEIKNLSEDEIQKIKDVYNLQLNDNDEIVSISFMSTWIDSFFVLKIKTSSPDEFCSNNQERFPEQQEFKTIPFFVSSYSYIPKKGQESIYYSENYVYISSWSYADTGISDLYLEIENNR